MHSRSVLCMTGHYNFYHLCMYVSLILDIPASALGRRHRHGFVLGPIWTRTSEVLEVHVKCCLNRKVKEAEEKNSAWASAVGLRYLMQRVRGMEQSRLFVSKAEVAAWSQAKILYELRVATTAITDSKSCCTVLLASCIVMPFSLPCLSLQTLGSLKQLFDTASILSKKIINTTSCH